MQIDKWAITLVLQNVFFLCICQLTRYKVIKLKVIGKELG